MTGPVLIALMRLAAHHRRLGDRIVLRRAGNPRNLDRGDQLALSLAQGESA